MSLGDIMGGSGLHLFAEVALLLFSGAFVAVGVSMLLRRNRDAFERARHMPLDEDRTHDTQEMERARSSGGRGRGESPGARAR